MNDVERDGILLAVKVIAITCLVILIGLRKAGSDDIKEAMIGAIDLELMGDFRKRDAAFVEKIAYAKKQILQAFK